MVNIALYGKLLLVSVLFMGTFQLVARLISYVFLFHEGILLMSSVLLGGGLFVIGFGLLRPKNQGFLERLLPALVAALFLFYIFLYFKTDEFLWHFSVLSLLFGTLFLQITRFIDLPANRFMAVELLGSFLGAGAIVALSIFVLEEQQIMVIATLGVLYVCVEMRARRYVIPLLVALLVPYGALIMTVSQHNLSTLVECVGYKAFCIDDLGGQGPIESIPSVKGRSGVYLRDTESPRQFTVRNTGVHAGTTQHEEEYRAYQYSYFDTEIPHLDYDPESRVVTMGASSGANVASFLKYIPNADISAVEIDRTIEKLYQRDAYLPYLPPRDAFSFVYGDARTTIMKSDEQYDVMGVIVEAVNSDLNEYVDESTSLVYTTEALQMYLDRLAPGGYLILQQYAAGGEAGDAMTNKMLGSLDAALPDAVTLSDHMLLYTNSFSSAPGAQRFAIVVYRDGGFTDGDRDVFTAWLTAMQTFEYQGVRNPFNLTMLHSPFLGVSYDQYFAPERKLALAEQYNTDIVTDDAPFRHLVTPRPFPDAYYAFYLIGGAILLALLVRAKKTNQSAPIQYVVASFILGVVTFGLQYTLFYKTAAFINTNLIFFAVFLLIPLFFGSIGGYLSTMLRPHTLLFISGLTAVLGTLLVAVDTFAFPPGFVLLMIIVLFLVSGMLFPLLLSLITKPAQRTMLYGVNIAAGGFASIIMITLHASVGWNIIFLTLLGIFITAFLFFSRSKATLV